MYFEKAATSHRIQIKIVVQMPVYVIEHPLHPVMVV